MTLGDLTRHRAWRRLPMWSLAAGINTSALLGALFLNAARDHEPIPAWTLILVGWVGLGVYLAFGDVRTRCTPFDMALPIGSHALWRVHLAAVATGGLVIVGLTMAVIALHMRLVPRVEFGPGVALVGPLLLAGLLLSILLLQVPRPSLARVPLSPGSVTWTVAVLVGMPGVLVATLLAGWAGPSALTLVTVGMAIWMHRTVPATYVLSPRQAVPASRAPTAAFGDGDRGPAWLVPFTVVRSLSTGFRELAAALFVFLFGVVLGGGLLALETGSANELRFLYLPLTVYMLLLLIGPRLASLHHLDPLPLSRRPLVAVLVLPYLLLTIAGYGAGHLVAEGARSRIEYVNLEKDEDGFHVTVPLRVYAFTEEEVTTVTAPWGETQTAEVLTLFGRGGPAVHAPFSAPPGSSTRFVALQISRAVEAVYGVELPPDRIASRYLTTDGDGRVVPRAGGLTLRTDFPELRPRIGPMFPALLALVVVPWLLLSALLLRAYRASIREWVRQTIVWGSLVVLLVMMVGSSMLPVFGGMRSWAPRALVEIPVMQLGATMGGTVLAWTVSTALILAAYWLTHRQFLRMEVPTTPSRYTLPILSMQE